MKTNEVSNTVHPTFNLEVIRAECLALVKKRAYFSAGAAIIPIPFLDVLIDVGLLTQLIPEISTRFGLEKQHTSVFDPQTKEIHWNELRKRGVSFSGIIFTRTAVKKSLNNFATRGVTKQVKRFIPWGGQIISAGIGYVVMKKVAEAHVEECYNRAKELQKQQSVTIDQ